MVHSQEAAGAAGCLGYVVFFILMGLVARHERKEKEQISSLLKSVGFISYGFGLLAGIVFIVSGVPHAYNLFFSFLDIVIGAFLILFNIVQSYLLFLYIPPFIRD